MTATSAKVAKNTSRPADVAASAPGSWPPSLIQIFLLEEGTYADQVVDITKFQNFVITVVLVLAYIAAAVNSVTAAGQAAVQFTRRYLNQPAGTPNDGWETEPGLNHVVSVRPR